MIGRFATMQVKRPVHAIFLALIIWLCVAGSSSAQDSRMLIDQVPVSKLFASSTPLTPDEHPKAQAALVKALNEQWKGQYRIVAQRFYIFARYDRQTFPQWVMLEKFVSNYFRDEVKGEKEYAHVSAFPEPIAAIWKYGDQRFAVAEAGDAFSDGGVLCGYFEVEKK